jgi:signal transduction histidine kinase
VELCAYRVVQEAVTNAIRHAPGSRVDVHLTCADDVLQVSVDNDAAVLGGRPGTGAPSVVGDGTGHGLAGLAERVSIFGGRLEAGPRPGGGYRVRATVPVGAPP